MLTIRLGKNGPLVSRLGYGCMGISEFYGRVATKEEAIKVIKSAYEKYGITHFDTADMYGKGLSEEELGIAVKDFRDKVVIATKCGYERKPQTVEINNSPEYIKKSCDESLKRLQTDYIDVYYLHRLNPEASFEHSLNALKELLEEGKIRYVGLSEVNVDSIRTAHKILGDKFVAVQSEFSLSARGPANAILPVCRELGISFVAYSPIARGFLSGAIKTANFFKQSDSFDFRATMPWFTGENFDKNYKLVQAIQGIASRLDCTPAQLSLAWLMAQGEDVVPIPGTSNLEHLGENVGACNVKLEEADLDEIQQVLESNPVAGLRTHQADLDALKMIY